MTKIKTYIIRSHEENSDYIVEEFHNQAGQLVHVLKFGTMSCWTNPKEIIATMVDTGNDLKIKVENNDKLKSLGYDTAEYLRILLAFNNRAQSKPEKYTVLTRRFTI